jgi:hypothetical protein
MMELLRQSGIEKDSTLLHLDCVGVISFMTCAYIGHSLEYAHAPRIVCASARLSSHPSHHIFVAVQSGRSARVSLRAARPQLHVKSVLATHLEDEPVDASPLGEELLPVAEFPVEPLVPLDEPE